MTDLTGQSQDARIIYQNHIDILTRSLMANTFETFVERIRFPHRIDNLNTCFVSRNADELRVLFDQMYESVKLDHVTDIFRIATSARFESPTEITGEHVTEILRGATRAVLPFRNRLRLVRGDHGIWLETNTANAIRLKARKMGAYVRNPDEDEPPELPM
jgi:hypothetical protein